MERVFEGPPSAPLSAREAATLALLEMERGGAYGGAAVKRQISRGSGGAPRVVVTDDSPSRDIDTYGGDGLVFSNLSALRDAREKGLLRELVYGVVRWKLTLDHIIFTYSKIKKEKIDPKIMAILRLGAYQIVFLKKIPASAACDESVKLAKKYGNAGSVRFVNAILRKIAAHGCGSLPTMGDAASLSARYSYPVWLCERWLARYGYDFSSELMDAGNRRPEFTIRVNATRCDAASLTEKLRARGFDVAPGRYSANALIINNPVDVLGVPEFSQGLFSVQDESSMLVVEALRPRCGERVLDACAAPGGKSGYIAEITGDAAHIDAADIRPHRLALLEQNAFRLGLKSINAFEMDASIYDARFEKAMDRVLVDAPCSGYGVVGKKPDIKWSKHIEDIIDIAELQSAILDAAARYVKPGGTLVYSVCTQEPEECGDIIKKFLSGAEDFFAEDARDYLPSALTDAGMAPAEGGGFPQASVYEMGSPGFYIYQHIHNIDGFYIARLGRRA